MNELLKRLYTKVQESPDEVLFTFLDFKDTWIEDDLTYKELFERSVAVANGLKENGITQDDKILILADNTKESLYSIYGAIIANIVFTILPPPIDNKQKMRFDSVMRTIAPKAILTSDRIIAAVKMMKIDMTEIHFYSVNKLSLGDNTYKPVEEINDLLYIQFTSGSTSEPKGVKVSKESLIANLEGMSTIMPSHNSKTVFSWVPFYHNIGFVVIVFSSVYDSRRTYSMPTELFIKNPALWIKGINDFKVQGTVAPNSAYDLCNKIFTPEKAKMFDLSSVNYFVTGSEKVYINTMTNFSKLFNVNIERFCPGYGLSETVAVCSFSSPLKILSVDKNDFYNNKITICNDEAKSSQLVSVGRNINCTKIGIIDLETQEKLSEGEIGEVVIAGPSVADGYYGITDERNEVFNIIDKNNRSLRTGDIGFLYDGDLFITGRKKEMIIINGQNFFPADFVEVIKNNISELAMSAIYAFSIDFDTKEHLVIIIEDYPDLENYHKCASRIKEVVNSFFSFSPYDIMFLSADSSLKKTDTGKIKIEELRKDYISHNFNGWTWLESSRDESECTNDIEEYVLEEFNKVLPQKINNMNLSFFELGGDSFDLLTIITNLEEKYKIKFDIKSFVSEPSVKGVADYIYNKIN